MHFPVCLLLIVTSHDHVAISEESLSRSGSVSPPGSPDTPPREEKFCPSPTKTEQKPFRGFDITSLIRKDDDKDGCVSVNLYCILFQ